MKIALIVLHVLLGLIAFGAAIAGFFRLFYLKEDSRTIFLTLKSVRTTERRFYTPALVLSIISGCAILGLSPNGISLQTSWIAISIDLLVGILAVGILFFDTRFESQISLAENGAAVGAKYRKIAQGAILWNLSVVITFIVVFALMIAKPKIW